jgi:YggT family protein
MILLIIQIVRIAASVFSWLIIIAVLLSYFVSPFNPIRQTIDNLVNPLLNPIRKVVPAFGGFDFSSVVLILLIQVVEMILISLLSAIG